MFKLKTSHWQLKLTILFILIYSSVMTPPDVYSLIIHAAPILVFAIVSFWIGSRYGVRQKAQEA